MTWNVRIAGPVGLLLLGLVAVTDRNVGAGPVEALSRRVLLAQDRLIGQLRFEPSDRQLPLGGKNEKLIVRDTLGETWIFKFVDVVRPISVRGELAAGALSIQVGGRVPEVHSITLRVNGEPIYGSLQRLLPLKGTLAEQAPEMLLPSIVAQLLEDQVFDWMVGDFDTKGENKGMLESGEVVNLDKTQFQRFFGQERLDWEFHPNSRPGNLPAFNAWIEPYANKLWKTWIARKMDIDPAPLGWAIDRWEALDEVAFEQSVRGFGRARSMILAEGWKVPPDRFVRTLLERKRTLRAAFTDFLERAGARAGRKPLELPPPRPRAIVDGEQVTRLTGELARTQGRLTALESAGPSARAGESHVEMPSDQMARLRLIAFKTAAEPLETVIRDLEAMRAKRAHPLARAGIDEYLERLRRFGRGEVRREQLESVQHGRGF